MISFNYEIDFKLAKPKLFSSWLSQVILSENQKEGEINYIFCDDDYLLEINQQYLNHDTLTDIINAVDFNVPFDDELQRVMVHGVLHYCGYKDKTDADETLMRSKEDEKMKLFHVEQK